MCFLFVTKTLYFPSCGSIPETAERAGRSVWYDRRLRKAEAAGSNPARSTFASARPLFESPLTLEVILDLKKQGKAEETINGYSRRLRHLAKNTDINDPETVKE